MHFAYSEGQANDQWRAPEPLAVPLPSPTTTTTTTGLPISARTTSSPVSAISRTLEGAGRDGMIEGRPGEGSGGWFGRVEYAQEEYQRFPATQHHPYHPQTQHLQQQQQQQHQHQHQYPSAPDMREYLHPESSSTKRKYPGTGSESRPPPPHVYPSFPPRDASSSHASSSTHPTAPPPNFVACTKCRHRKIKCGGQRPVCENCEKKGLKCVYDVVVKRRGPDKKPGGRMKKRHSGTAVAVEGEAQQETPPMTHGRRDLQPHVVSPASTNTPSSSSSAPHPMDELRPSAIPEHARPQWTTGVSPLDGTAPTASSNSPETVLSIPRSRAESMSSATRHGPYVSVHSVPPPLPYGYVSTFVPPPLPPPPARTFPHDHPPVYPPNAIPSWTSGYPRPAVSRYAETPFHPPTYPPTHRPPPLDLSHAHPPPAQTHEVWSPSVVGKLGMADLVTGYDPVQHIAAGANVGLGMESEASAVVVKR